MSRPDLAVEAVELLTDLGYGASMDIPRDGDTRAFVIAWPTDGQSDGSAIPGLVRHVDRRAVEQHAPERDAFGDERSAVELPLDELHEGSNGREQSRDEPIVRSRPVWSGVACTAIGIVVTGVGLMAQTWWVVGVGIVLALVGVGAVLAGGGLYDVRASRSPESELHDVRHGEAHEGVEPGEMVRDPRVEQSAAEIERGRRRLLSRAGSRHRPRR